MYIWCVNIHRLKAFIFVKIDMRSFRFSFLCLMCMYVNLNDHLTVHLLYTNHTKDYLMKINIRHMTNVMYNHLRMIDDRSKWKYAFQFDENSVVWIYNEPSSLMRERTWRISCRRSHQRESALSMIVDTNKTNRDFDRHRASPWKAKARNVDFIFSSICLFSALSSNNNKKKPDG